MSNNKSFYILNIDTELNSGLLPIYINDNEIINNDVIKFDDYKFLRSQYSLELVLHNMFRLHPNLTQDYKTSDIVFTPVYLFCSAWVKSPLR
jgi:hypothetical protein